ncbi:ATP-binding protein [Massilia sp. BKSP1R2A-1]|uniref:sensor histidine kinase n=1 Tax=Massilia sp. BKSP1R2A-1 TaxID=3422595 RepID=UPI003D34681B
MSTSLDEARRLRVLLDLNILDTAAEERFDRITRMAARLFGVPMAFVSLVDADRLWFKSQVGFPFSETPSDKSFCLHAVQQDGMLVVCDARADERFAASPHVTGFPQVRFYAGMPIAVNGACIGTFCLVDTVAREFAEEDRAMLRDLAAVVANEVAATALQEAQARQRSSEAALRTLLEHLPDSVLLLDGAGAVVAGNPAAEALFGMDAAALSGQAAAALLGVPAERLQPEPGAGPLRLDCTVAGPGGPRQVEAALSRLEIDGRAHLVLAIHDVSARRAALEAAQAAEERRRAYFRTATHELRTPMASILGFSELLVKRDFDPATGRELLGIIHTQSTRLVDLINQMLELARLDAGGPDEQRRAVIALPALVAASVSAAATRAPERAADLAVRGADAPLAPILANPQRLQQALEQLLANALRFSQPGSAVTVAMAPAVREGRAGAMLAIRDQGIGMAPAHQARMFDAFYRAGERPDLEGHGLGLTLVREVLGAHGAAIEVASRPGAGTTVTVWLPATQDAAEGAR